MPTTVLWNPTALNAAVDRAFRQAAQVTRAAIEATKPQHEIPVRGPFFGAGGNVATIRAGGLAPIFEKGAKRHEIFPKGAIAVRRGRSKGQATFSIRAIRGHSGQVLKLSSPGTGSGFAAYVDHPGMKARPFLAPQAAMFRSRFNQIARVNLATAGFRKLAA